MPGIEDLGFSREHRKDAVDINEQIVQTDQVFSDIGIPGQKLSELSVDKLIAGTIRSQTITLAVTADEGDVYIAAGKTDFTNVESGFILGIDDSDSDKVKFSIGNDTSYMDWNITAANTLTIVGNISATTGTIGGFTIGADYIRDAANSMGLSSTVTGGDDVRFWAGDTFANRASAPFNVTESGALRATGAIVNDSVLGFQNIFGDGSDGDVVISSNTTLTEDMFYDDLTIDAGYTLNTGGFRVHVRGVLTINGTLGRPGNDGGNGGNGANGDYTTGPEAVAGTAGSAGAALADGSVSGAVAGTAGSAGVNGRYENGGFDGYSSTRSSNADDIVKSLTGHDGVKGGQGGDGGDAKTSNGGTCDAAGTGTAGVTSGTVFNKPNTSFSCWLLQDFFPATDSLKSSAGSSGGNGGSSGAVAPSGGSGASGGSGGGGGAGGSGGIVPIFAKKIIIGATGVISANGGDGGDGGNAGLSTCINVSGSAAGGSGGGGGGGAGNGGVVLMVYSLLINTGSITVAAGTAGTGGTGSPHVAYGSGTGTDGDDGSDGAAANDGIIIQLQV